MERTHAGRRLMRASIGAFRRDVMIASVLFGGHQTGEALVPVLVGVVIDEAVRTGDPVALAGWLVVLGLDFAMLSFSYRQGARHAWRADIRAGQRLRLLLAARVLDPRGGAETGRLPGGLASVATSDTKRVGIVSFALPLGIAAGVALVVATVSLMLISIPLGLLILLGLPPLLYLVELLGRPIERRAEPEQEQSARALGVAADLVAGIRVLKGIGAEPVAAGRYAATNRAALAATLRATTAQAWYQGAVLAANGLFLALVALVGGRMAATGQISIGGLVAAVGLAQFLVGPLETIGWVGGRLAQARASAARVADVLATAPAVRDGRRSAPPDGPGGLRVRALVHGPLRGLDLDVAPGELVGVVAPDPAAGAALMACLGRETDAPDGVVELDGVALGDYPPDVARRTVIVATHDAELFAGTVTDNVRAGAPAGRDLTPAVVAARVDQVSEVLPAGYATQVTAQGRSLSGGQRQRVALARALATQAPVLVLHDPTTALDPVTEAHIAAGLRDVRRGATTVVLTSSPALLAVTDRVLLLLDGRVVAEGTHDRLQERADYRAAVLV